MNLFVLVSAFIVLLSVGSNYAFRKQFRTYEEGVILVTGASTGIGRHSVLDLASTGFTVFAGVRRSADGESLVQEAVRLKMSGKIHPVILDVTDDSHILNACKKINETLSATGLPFVGLVNNAGIADLSPFEVMPTEVARKIFEVNYWGVVKTTQTFLPLIRRHQGRVVSISSVAGLLVAPGYGTYSSSKYALEAGMDALRREISKFGCSVSLVEPGFVITEIGKKGSMALPLSSPDLVDLYSDIYERHKGRVGKVVGEGPEVTSVAIRHALTSPHPQTRYPVAGVNGFPATAIAVLAGVLPDNIADLMLETFN